MEGSRAKKFFILISGRARISKDASLIGIIRAGSTFGEKALFSDEVEKNTVTLKAESMCDLLILRRADMRALLEQHPDYCSRVDPYIQSLPLSYLQKHAALLTKIAESGSVRRVSFQESRPKRLVRLVAQKFGLMMPVEESDEASSQDGQDEDGSARSGIPLESMPSGFFEMPPQLEPLAPRVPRFSCLFVCSTPLLPPRFTRQHRC